MGVMLVLCLFSYCVEFGLRAFVAVLKVGVSIDCYSKLLVFGCLLGLCLTTVLMRHDFDALDVGCLWVKRSERLLIACVVFVYLSNAVTMLWLQYSLCWTFVLVVMFYVSILYYYYARL
eukprot:gene3544-2495_t